jgi:hypothetical protein
MRYTALETGAFDVLITSDIPSEVMDIDDSINTKADSCAFVSSFDSCFSEISVLISDVYDITPRFPAADIQLHA